MEIKFGLEVGDIEYNITAYEQDNGLWGFIAEDRSWRTPDIEDYNIPNPTVADVRASIEIVHWKWIDSDD